MNGGRHCLNQAAKQPSYSKLEVNSILLVLRVLFPLTTMNWKKSKFALTYQAFSNIYPFS